LPSDIIADFLYSQLENLDRIQKRRTEIWDIYNKELASLREMGVKLPYIPTEATNNAHMYYIVCKDLNERTQLIKHLKAQEINTVFHYLSLHKSPYYINKHDGRALSNADNYTDCLLRLPMYFELTNQQVLEVSSSILSFFKAK